MSHRWPSNPGYGKAYGWYVPGPVSPARRPNERQPTGVQALVGEEGDHSASRRPVGPMSHSI
ncbi:hypothetical protein ZHAS_00009773 [Anopheles sinensis]|uniref:Uncharacterized protein n=1 Tax=Anopheles sinensis TaxID=74873 RepID=A0A084VVW8_ANOSI|nr:hypothetical protein ZHAS_00009773 [Anopheles sinensis]